MCIDLERSLRIVVSQKHLNILDIRKLVDSGIGYDTLEMAQAVKEYTDLKSLWDNLEQEYLALRDSISKE